MNQRGFILVEFVIALPILILLLYSLVTLTLTTAKISREQVADYVLETEAQEVIDRITIDARSASSVKIISADTQNPLHENIIFLCDSLTNKIEAIPVPDENEESGFRHVEYHKEILNPRIYAVHSAKTSADGKLYPHIYFKRQEDSYYSNPITGENSFGNTFVEEMKFSIDKDAKILHITLTLKSLVTNQKVKFSTAVFMPNCEEFL